LLPLRPPSRQNHELRLPPSRLDSGLLVASMVV
jgi:hypothetical protein